MLPIPGFNNVFLTFRYEREADGSKTPTVTKALIVTRGPSPNMQYVFACGKARYNPADRKAGLPLSKAKGRGYALSDLVRVLGRMTTERLVTGELKYNASRIIELANGVVNAYANRKTANKSAAPTAPIPTREDWAHVKLVRGKLAETLKRISHIAHATDFIPVASNVQALLLHELDQAHELLKAIIAAPFAGEPMPARRYVYGTTTGRITLVKPNFQEIPRNGENRA